MNRTVTPMRKMRRLEMNCQRYRTNNRALLATLPRALALVMAVLLATVVTPVSAQFDSSTFSPEGFGQSDAFGEGTDVFDSINFGGISTDTGEPYQFSAKYFSSEGKGRVEVEAVIGKSWHIYSTTQPSGGPLPTKLKIKSPATVTIVGPVEPDEAPTKSVSDIYPGVTIEEHEGTVVWSAPIELPAGFEGDIEVDIKSLVCKTGGSCMPANETLIATRAGPFVEQLSVASTVDAETADPFAADSSKATKFQDEDYEVSWLAGVSASIAAGQRGELLFRAKPSGSYHVYSAKTDDSRNATNFIITEKHGLKVGKPHTEQPLIKSKVIPSVRYHDGEATWSLPISVPEDTSAKAYDIKGYIAYQACNDTSCLQPMAFEFTATVHVADKTDLALQPIKITTVKYIHALDAAAEVDWVDPVDPLSGGETLSDAGGDTPADSVANNDAGNEQDDTAVVAITDESGRQAGLPVILLLAFGGGIILNLMPCVLPVVGLKVMSFVQQAGEDRKRVMLLNFAYVAGILCVFALLAGLAVFASFGWGQQLAYFPVRLGLTVLVFALALSYLGVWELPTPGIATGNKSQDLQQREGPVGAFFTGVFATLMATPCSGPLLGAALAYTISLPGPEKAAVLMTVGLGMSMPYIVLGIFPSLVSFLPKPGNWMVTLKEFLAFLFLGTVAFFFNQFSDAQKLPVFVTLIGVWFGCWVVGKVPPWESMRKQIRGWSIGVVSAVAIGFFAFTYLTAKPVIRAQGSGVEYIVDDHLRWEKYDEQRLKELHAMGKTVMLDFTAAWCVNCIVNKEVALDTEQTRKMLDELDGVAMLADLTDQPEDLVRKLETELGSKSIPMLAIYPGKSPEKPIILRDLVTQGMVLSALESAGPSVGGTNKAANIAKQDSANTDRSTSYVTSAAITPVGTAANH
ncbi:protein-disulfide reductase DsbD family protein [Rhodopirellula sp. MGV]|uniref:protein-disulfide reductase DsbD family protein n=1 Tax=Rhodopirellula sp. MGV TaxID=2023130 RepID=UPI00117B0144|nr:protein-disulfide reductase DsbD domain-containing protein [Rhodopirellula sp. MGV]